MRIIVIKYKIIQKCWDITKRIWIGLIIIQSKESYPNRYVAINDKKIVESDRVLDELLERLKTNYHDSWHRFAIEFVDEEEPQICLINDQK